MELELFELEPWWILTGDHLRNHNRGLAERYWTVDVEIIGTWEDGPEACVVHRQTVDPTKILGHRFEFTSGSPDGTIEGYARDIAFNLNFFPAPSCHWPPSEELCRRPGQPI